MYPPKNEHVNSHKRKGKFITDYWRSTSRSIKKKVSSDRSTINVTRIKDLAVIDIPPELFNQIKTGLVDPIESLISNGFSEDDFDDLYKFGGINENGQAVLRNTRDQSMHKVQLINLSAPNMALKADLG